MGKDGNRTPGTAPPTLLDPVDDTKTVPLLTDAVVDAALPILDQPVAGGATPIPAATVAALREALTVVARDLTRECIEDVLEETRMELEQRLSGRFEEELRELIERALRAHLERPD